ncbi:MAG: hypothetical protein ACRD4O_06795, partial [Bryobacteraceae bacterium]
MGTRRLKFAVLVLLPCLWPLAARAVSCTTQSDMTPAQRNVYEQASRSLGSEIAAGNVAAVRADTIASVAAQFGPITATIEQV